MLFPFYIGVSDDEASFLKENVCVGDRMELFGLTLGQASNPLWFTERRLRISASRAHQIFSGRKNDTRLKYFFGSSVQTPAVEYGRRMEETARKKFVEVTDKKVLPSGLIVHAKQPWLSCSPDGIVIDNNNPSLLEIKCPSRCEGTKINVDYLTQDGLKKSHPYYTQVQLQLYVANVNLCYFFVYSEADYVLVPISKDDDYL